MANIEKELATIAYAIYGEQVRGSIHDAIEKINTEVERGISDAQFDTIVADGIKAAFEDGFMIMDGDF